jgi:tripartite-type tricarboxylate transporter receptor subunit TctC
MTIGPLRQGDEVKSNARICTLLSGLVLAAAAVHVHAQAWPNKPIRILNPFPAGGGTDTFARPLAAKLSQSLGQSVFIENQGGGGGTIGAGNAARAAPAGYTFFMGAIHHTIAESVYTKLPYGIEKDFVPITVVAYVPQVMVVHPKHPFRTIKELVDYAKANPGKLNFGSPGSGTAHHLAMELFMGTTGIQMVHIPYRGAGPMMQDFLAGMVDVVFDGMGTSAAQIKGGKLRGLAVATPTRLASFPDIPTMDESGVPGMVVSTWYALWAIKGTPKEVVDKFYAETVKVLDQKEIKDIWANAASDVGGMPPDQFGVFVNREIARWAKVVKDAGVKLDP